MKLFTPEKLFLVFYDLSDDGSFSSNVGHMYTVIL
jgi:hypothetical protein